MGATLKRRGACFRWKRDSWDDLLLVAKEHGWTPLGTLAPRGVRKSEWNTEDYLTCARQQVTDEDALGLARALSRAVKSVRNSTSKPPTSIAGSSELLSGYAIGGMKDFIAFCRHGAFRITDDVCDN